MTPSPAPLRLLFLAPYPPRLDGVHGGSRVIAQLLDRLAERHHVGLMCVRHPSEPPVDERLRARLELVEELETIDRGRSHRTRTFRGVRDRLHVVAGAPLWATSLKLRAFRRRLAAVLDDWNPDLVQIQYTAMGVYAAEVEATGRPVVLWEPDPATNAAIELGVLASGNRILRRLDVRAWRRFERSVLHRVTAVVVFTERDRRLVAASAGGTPVVAIPFGTDFVEREFARDAGDHEILFVGNFVHPPNIDAAMRLVREIFPRVRERRPGTSLRIVGDHPPPQLVAAADGDTVVAGRVPDLTPDLERAAVVAAPLRFGGGMRVKILEALAAGKPLVASPLATEGLDVKDGRQLLLASTDQEFVDRIVRLLDDDELRARLGQDAWAWAQRHLGWDECVERYEELFRSLVA
jgi:glycosyltransferase involved in cell wall biosynthesis